MSDFVTLNTRLRLINRLPRLIDLENDDLFLVQRGLKSYKVRYEDFGAPTVLVLSVESALLDYQAQSDSFDITTNNEWSASTSDNWITLNSTEGAGETTFTYSVTENSGPQRQGEILIESAGNTSKTFTVTQQSGPDAIPDSDAFIMTINTSGPDGDLTPINQFSIVSVGNTIIDWGDGVTDTFINNTNITHTYPSQGEYVIKIKSYEPTEFCSYHFFSGYINPKKILSVSSWGNSKRSSCADWFNYARNLSSVPMSSIPVTDSVTNFDSTWYYCQSLTDFPQIDTSSGTNFDSTWYYCRGLTSFPQIDTSSGTNFNETWYSCRGLTDFPQIDTSNGTDFNYTWESCNSLTSFPQIDTSSGTNFDSTWRFCQSLTDFPQIDTSSGTNFNYTWQSCGSLTSFPQIDTSSGTNFNSTWQFCYNLTDFPQIDTSSGTNFNDTWFNCQGLTDFPQIDTSSGTNFDRTWVSCYNLTSFPQIDTSSGTNFDSTWYYCRGLTSFPQIDTSNGTDFDSTWQSCGSLTSFPQIDTSNANERLYFTWYRCKNLTSFPHIDIENLDLWGTWAFCSSLKYLEISSYSGIEIFAYENFRYIDKGLYTNDGEYGEQDFKEYLPIGAFQGCVELTGFGYAPDGVFNTSGNLWIPSAFEGCTKLEYIPTNQSSFDVINMKEAFEGCEALRGFDCDFNILVKPTITPFEVNSGFGSGALFIQDTDYYSQSLYRTFYNCTLLSSIPIVNTSGVEDLIDITESFNGCLSLTSIPQLDFINVVTADAAFNGWTIDSFNVIRMDSLSSADNFVFNIPTLDYDNLLSGMATYNLIDGDILDVGTSTHSVSANTFKTTLTNNGWTIQDGGSV